MKSKSERDLAEFNICNDAIEAYGNAISGSGYGMELIARRAVLAQRLGITI
jgi:hypothetical protein